MKVYIVHYRSASGGARGFHTYDTMADAKVRVAKYKAMRWRAWIVVEERN